MVSQVLPNCIKEETQYVNFLLHSNNGNYKNDFTKKMIKTLKAIWLNCIQQGMTEVEIMRGIYQAGYIGYGVTAHCIEITTAPADHMYCNTRDEWIHTELITRCKNTSVSREAYKSTFNSDEFIGWSNDIMSGEVFIKPWTGDSPNNFVTWSGN